MKIEYKFVNGEKSSVEVNSDLAKIILELDRDLYNNNQIETSQHISLNSFGQDKKDFTDNYIRLENQMLKRIDRNALYKAILSLEPYEQQLIHKLYLSDTPITQKQYASILGVTENAVRKRFAKLKTKLKKLVYVYTYCL